MSVLALVPMLPADIALARQSLAGRPVLDHTLAALHAAASVDDVLVVAVDAGSVTAALAEALAQRPPADVVVIHDPLRPLVPPALIEQVIDAVRRSPARAAVPVLPVTDTLKSVDADGYVIGTVDRALFQVVSTPVAVGGATLRAELAAPAVPAEPAAAREGRVDLAVGLVQLLAARGVSVMTVAGVLEGLRVAEDAHIAIAAALLARPSPLP